VEVQPLLFASFVPLVYPDNDETKRPLRDLYCELTNKEKVQKEVVDGLSSYNTRNSSKKMNLVLSETPWSIWSRSTESSQQKRVTHCWLVSEALEESL